MEEKEIFIKELKEKYKTIYTEYKDIPYIKDKLVARGIQTAFVWPSIQVRQQSWRHLSSYRDVFRIHQKRIILQGPQGSGKTTLSLQYANDWCEKEDYLKHVDLLIYLLWRQLEGEKSIYTAIKHFILPENSNVTHRDIELMMVRSPSVVVILDSLEDIRDDQSKNEVMKIISKSEFKRFQVISTTTYLPNSYKKGTVWLRLSEFNDKLQNEYITKAVPGNDTREVGKLRELFEKTPILRDICRIPFFLVLITHMLQDSKTSQSLMSVTSCFRFIMEHLQDNLRKKATDDKEKNNFIPEGDHRELDKAAFDGIQQNKMFWRKDQFLQKIGKECYEHYKALGILVEEKVSASRDESNASSNQWSSTSSVTTTQREVRFFHNIFCEWFAAHYLSQIPTTSTASEFERTLHNVSSTNAPYLYRFACGLNPKITDSAIKCIQKKKGDERVGTMCMLEHNGEGENVSKSVKRLCQGEITVSSNMDKFAERSIFEVLRIAHQQRIPISCLTLSACFGSLDHSAENLILRLQPNVFLPPLDTLLKLVVNENARSFSDEETNDILLYSASCQSLKWLKFNNCLLPKQVSTDTLRKLLSRKVKVWWRPPGFMTFTFRLSLKSGMWKNIDNGEKITGEEYEAAISRETFRLAYSV